MAEPALRTGSPPHVAHARRRENAGERARFDRPAFGRADWSLAPPSRAEPPNAAIPWPVPPSRGHGETFPSVAPPRVEPVVVVLPRITATDLHAEAAPPVAPVDPFRDAVPPRRRSTDRSLSGVAIAVVLHLAGMAGLLAMPRSEPPGGGGAIETVELVMFDTPSTVDQVAGGPTAPVAVAEPDPDPTPTPAEPPPPSEPEAVVAEAEPPPPPPPVAEPEPAIAPAVSETPLPILVTRQAEDRVAAAPTPPLDPPPPAAPKPKPEARPVERARKPAPKPTRPAKAEAPAKKIPAATAAAPGDAARTRTSGARGAGPQAAAGSGTVADWRSTVLAALARAKRYPVDAHDRGVVGRAVIRFTVTRDGTVTAVSLVTSSGAAVLDAATLAMPRRAAFPPMPVGGPATQTFTAGVRYDLH